MDPRPLVLLGLTLVPALAAEPALVPRAAWGAAPAGPGLVAQRPRRLTVHHTATRSPEDPAEVARLLQGIQRYHQGEKGWPDLAYHLLIDRAGRVHEGRGIGFQGSSGTVYDLADRVLVCLIGDFTAEPPPDAQWLALVEVLAGLCRQHGIPPRTITMHRDEAATTCPGDALAERIRDGDLLTAVRRAWRSGSP